MFTWPLLRLLAIITPKMWITSVSSPFPLSWLPSCSISSLFSLLTHGGKETFAPCSSSCAGPASPAAHPGILWHLLELQISTEKDHTTTKPCLACPWCKNKLSVNLLLLQEAEKSQTCPPKQAGRTFPYLFASPCSVIQCLMCSKLHLFFPLIEENKWPDSILLPTWNRKLLLKQPPAAIRAGKIKGMLPQGLAHVEKSNSTQEHLPCLARFWLPKCSSASSFLHARGWGSHKRECPQGWMEERDHHLLRALQGCAFLL